MSTKSNILLDYNVPVTFKRSADGKVLIIEGIAIDDTVNRNMWQVPQEELPYFVAMGQNVQIRVDHGDKIEDVKGVVNFLRMPQVAADGRMEVPFKGEVSGDEELLNKIEKEYVNSVSPRVVGEAFCSACGCHSRDENMNLVHICRGAWEIMRKPQLVELSIVSKGAYEHTRFRPVGFAAAMTAAQQIVISKALNAKGKHSCMKCAGALTFDCLGCDSQVRFNSFAAGEANPIKNQKGEKNIMSAEGNKTNLFDADAVKAMIEQHAKNLAEACRQSIAEACKQTVEACNKSEAEAKAEAIKAASEAAKEAVKAESAAMMAKLEDFINKATAKQRASGKGAVGSLDEKNQKPPAQQVQWGKVVVPSYFGELFAAAERRKSLDALHIQEGRT